MAPRAPQVFREISVWRDDREFKKAEAIRARMIAQESHQSNAAALQSPPILTCASIWQHSEAYASPPDQRRTAWLTLFGDMFSLRLPMHSPMPQCMFGA